MKISINTKHVSIEELKILKKLIESTIKEKEKFEPIKGDEQ